MLPVAWVMFRYPEPVPASRGGPVALSMVTVSSVHPSAGDGSGLLRPLNR